MSGPREPSHTELFDFNFPELAQELGDRTLVSASEPFLTLPAGLLDALQTHLGEYAFDPEAWRIERLLSERFGDHAQSVGLWRGEPVSFYLLRRNGLDTLTIDQSLLRDLGWDLTLAQVQRQLSIGEERSEWLSRIAKGYAGWLMTNAQFLDEHDRFLADFSESALDLGLPFLPMAAAEHVPLEASVVAPLAKPFRDALMAFCLRWRLSGLAAPDLPVPIRPMMPMAPTLAKMPLTQAGALFFLPDTFPIPSRDELRGILDESLHTTVSPHLADWAALVAGNKTVKSPIERFARLFELQHYCRQLQRRHATAINRRKDKIELALATFLSVSEATVHGDLLFISRRLGRDWACRGTD